MMLLLVILDWYSFQSLTPTASTHTLRVTTHPCRYDHEEDYVVMRLALLPAASSVCVGSSSLQLPHAILVPAVTDTTVLICIL